MIIYQYMKKYLWIVFVIVVIIVGAFVVSRNTETSKAGERQTVKIGVTLPLTGPVSMLGESVRGAILLAKENIKNTKYDYEFVFEDDAFSPKQAVSTVNKLISVDKVDALISFGSPVGNVVSPIAEQSRIVHINDFASDTNVAKGDYNFLHYTPPYKDSALFISELQKRNIKNIVFFGQQDNPGANALIMAFEKDIKGSNIKVLSTQKFNTGTKDFKTEILKVKNLGADIYVLEATSPELEILTRQLREAGIKAPVTTMEAFEFSDQLSLFEGMWYVNGADPSQYFVDLYKAKYGSFPKFGAGNAYDVVNLIVKAAESAGDGKTKPTSTDIKDALSNIKSFDGVMGKNMGIDSNGQVMSEPVVRIIRNGVPVTISK
jgi:branched-chain amino acid transport system substrate-binding protein